MRASAASRSAERELGFLHFARHIFGDGGEAAIQKTLLHIDEDDAESGLGADVGDSVAHGSGADDADGFDSHGVLRMRLREVRQANG